MKTFLRNKWAILTYRFTHWLFCWVLDSDGDVGILIFQRLLLVKYKEHTAVSWESKPLRPAPKYLEGYKKTSAES